LGFALKLLAIVRVLQMLTIGRLDRPVASAPVGGAA